MASPQGPDRAGVGDDVGRATRTVVLVPTFNEAENLQPLLSAILDEEPGLEILVIDDASPDGTGALADSLAATEKRLHVLHRAAKLGLGSAYVAGFRWALEKGYDLIVEMDADFSHRPEDLPRLLEAAQEADLVIGSRNIPGGRVENWSWVRKLISRWGSLYARLVLGVGPRDYTSGFKCFRRSALQVLDLDKVKSNGYAFQVEINYAVTRAGLAVREVPIVFPDRRLGASKMSTKIALEAAGLVLRLRTGTASVALNERPTLGRASR